MKTVNIEKNYYVDAGVRRGAPVAEIRKTIKAKKDKYKNVRTSSAKAHIADLDEAAEVLCHRDSKGLHDECFEAGDLSDDYDVDVDNDERVLDDEDDSDDLSSSLKISLKSDSSPSSSTALVKKAQFSDYFRSDLKPKPFLGRLKQVQVNTEDDWRHGRYDAARARHIMKYANSPLTRAHAGDAWEVLAVQERALQVRKRRVTEDLAEHREAARRLKLRAKKQIEEDRSARNIVRIKGTIEKRRKQGALGYNRSGKYRLA